MIILVGFFGFEFPRYNYAYNGKQYKYLYGCGFGEALPDRLVKIDTETKVNYFVRFNLCVGSNPRYKTLNLISNK